ncbi:MAG: DUF167 domain-containing protein [Patescibacteria group bacterium]
MPSVNLRIKVVPNSKRPGVAVSGAQVIVRVGAPPIEGKANIEVCEILADTLKLPKTAIQIKKGEKSKYKLVLISGIDEPKLFAILSRQEFGKSKS